MNEDSAWKLPQPPPLVGTFGPSVSEPLEKEKAPPRLAFPVSPPPPLSLPESPQSTSKTLSTDELRKKALARGVDARVLQQCLEKKGLVEAQEENVANEAADAPIEKGSKEDAETTLDVTLKSGELGSDSSTPSPRTEQSSDLVEVPQGHNRPSEASAAGSGDAVGEPDCHQMATHVNGMSSQELHRKATARLRTMKKFNEVALFDVLLRREGKPLGLTFKLPEAVSRTSNGTIVQQTVLSGLELKVPDKDADMEKVDEASTHDVKEPTTLLVVDIVERSAVDDYNRAQAAAGAWDRVVLPGMHVCAVNGIRGDSLAMANALCKSEVSTVRFLYLRRSEVSNESRKLEPLQLQAHHDNALRLLEERVSKLVRMEGEEIVNAMRTQAEWEAMSSSLASALVKEVYKGDRVMQQLPEPPGFLPPPVPLGETPLPAGVPPKLPPLEMLWDTAGAEAHDELSDSEESV